MYNIAERGRCVKLRSERGRVHKLMAVNTLRRVLAASIVLSAALAMPVGRACFAQRAGAGGGHAGILLELPSSARALGVADAVTALPLGAASLFYNPAQLATTARWGANVSVQRHLAGSTLAAGALAGRASGGVMAVGVQALGYGSEPEVRCPLVDPDCTAGDPTGRRVSAGDLVVAAGYARAFGGMRFGIGAKLLRQEIAGEAGTTAAVDLGVAGAVAPWLTLGAAMQHLGRDLRLAGQRAPLPRVARAGVAFMDRRLPGLEAVAVTLLADALWRDGAAWRGAGGAELTWRATPAFALAGRAGMTTRATGASRRWGAGGSLVGRRIALDYAFQDFAGIGEAHRVGVRAWR